MSECDSATRYDHKLKKIVPTNECDDVVEWICDQCQNENIPVGKCPGVQEYQATCGHESCGVDFSHFTGEDICRHHQYLGMTGRYRRSPVGWPT